MKTKELRERLKNIGDDEEVMLCNVHAPISAAVPIDSTATVALDGSPQKLIIMFDTKKEGR